MAIGECPECKKAVSTGASTCPHCGYAPRGCLARVVIAILAMIILLGALAVVGSLTTPPEQPAPKPPAGQPICDAVKAEQAIQQGMAANIIHHIDKKKEVSRVYVLEPWNQLTLDTKRAMDTVVQCYVTNGMPNGRSIIVYHDARNDKKLARSSAYGFELL